jgi:hypothetical protein
MATNGTIPPVTPAALPAVVGPRSAQVARGEGSSGGNLGTFGVSHCDVPLAFLIPYSMQVKSGLAQMLKVCDMRSQSRLPLVLTHVYDLIRAV